MDSPQTPRRQGVQSLRKLGQRLAAQAAKLIKHKQEEEAAPKADTLPKVKLEQPSFWARVRQAQARKITKDEAKQMHDAIWGVKQRLADSHGRQLHVTNHGQLVSPARDLRREAERAGLATTGRQWRKLRKQMAREEREMAKQREATNK